MKIVFLVNSAVLAEIHKEITKKTYFLCRPIPEIIKKPIFQIGQYQYWIFFLWINSPESGNPILPEFRGPGDLSTDRPDLPN